MAKLLIILFSFVVSFIAFAMDDGLTDGVILGNQNKAEGAYLMSVPNMSFDECVTAENGECVLKSLVPRGTKVLIDRGVIVGKDAEGIAIKALEVRVKDSDGNYVTGYVEESAVFYDSTAVVCEEHTPKPRQQVTQDVEEIVEKVLEEDDTDFKMPWWRTMVEKYGNNKCKRFMNSKGEMGDLGKKMIKIMHSQEKDYVQKYGKSCFFNNDEIMRDICPKFMNFSQGKKEEFYANMWGLLAFKESSCDPRKDAQGTNDLADGLLAMEYSQVQRRRAGRSARHCASRRGVDSKSLTFQLTCSASIVVDTVCKKNNKINYNSGYWKEMRYNVCKRYRKVNGRLKCTGGYRRGLAYKIIRDRFPGCK